VGEGWLFKKEVGQENQDDVCYAGTLLDTQVFIFLFFYFKESRIWKLISYKPFTPTCPVKRSYLHLSLETADWAHWSHSHTPMPLEFLRHFLGNTPLWICTNQNVPEPTSFQSQHHKDHLMWSLAFHIEHKQIVIRYYRTEIKKHAFFQGYSL
jgi:hypothetical protein